MPVIYIRINTSVPKVIRKKNGITRAVVLLRLVIPRLILWT